MATERFAVADVDGTLCVKYTTTDYSNPSIVTHYWPTVARTYDAVRHFFDDEDVRPAADKLAELHVVQSRPGEYFIGTKQTGFGAPWKRGQHVRLVDGSITTPVKTDVTDAIAPKVRKGVMLYWSGGYWVKHTSKGVVKIDPLA